MTIRRQLAAVCLFVALLVPLRSNLGVADPTPTERKTQLAAPRVRIAMDHSYRHALVDVWIDGNGPYPFILDTGATRDGAIDRSVAEDLGLKKTTGFVQVDDGTGFNLQISNCVQIERLDMTGVNFFGAQLVITDLRELYTKDSFPPDEIPVGILGLGLFRDLVLTIDYPRNRIELRRRALKPDPEGHVIPYREKETLADLTVWVGNTKIEACVDTGSQGDFTVPLSYRERLSCLFEPIESAHGRTTNNEYKIRSSLLRDPLFLAGYRLDHVKVSFNPLFNHAILGYGFLRSFSITFDQKNKLVALVKAGGLQAEEGANLLGIFTRPHRGRPVLIAVDPGSPADIAGLEVGDVILELQGQNIRDLTRLGRLYEILQEPTDLTMVVRRGNQSIRFQITTDPWKIPLDEFPHPPSPRHEE